MQKPRDDGVMQIERYATYIMSNLSMTLYVGVTNDLVRRVGEHKSSRSNFTTRYHCDRLVWFSRFKEITQAIETEKRIKGWTRAKKIALVKEMNPQWKDLSLDLYD
jgi:putative endonuclease